MLAVGVVLTVLAPLGFALLPALRMSRPDMDELRQGNRGAETASGRRLRESLVVAQVALALILMTQVGLDRAHDVAASPPATRDSIRRRC